MRTGSTSPRTATAVGQTALVDYRPKTAAYTVQTQVTTVAADQPTIQVSLPQPGVFLVTGQIAEGQAELRVGSIPDPAAFARTAFIEALQRAGVEVKANVSGPNPAKQLPKEGSYKANRLVAEHVSAELSELTRVVLKTSHNPGADLLSCLVAVKAGNKDCPAGPAAEAQYAAGLGIPADSLFIFDGAGSDNFDMVTGKAMTSFFRALDSQPIGEAFETSLSIIGVDGDLAESEKGTPTAGQIRAKTGTRANVTPAGTGILATRTLVGYANAKSGRQLIISVMVRNVPFNSFEELFAVVDDGSAIAGAMQQAY